jgi:predicted DNA-binding transcriptional regulator AlpA
MARPLWDVSKVCEHTRMSEKFVYRNALAMGGIKVGRHLRFRPEDVEAWLDSRKLRASRGAKAPAEVSHA